MGRCIKGIQVVDVEKRREPAKHYVYVIFVTWNDGCSFVIYRRYSRFFDLQSKLLDKFPIEAGSVEPEQRTIPFLPGKIIFGRSHIREVALKRMEPINEYCKKIIELPAKISQCEEVLNFFEVDADDLDPPALSNKLKDQQTAEKISKPKQLEQFVVICDYEPDSRGEISLQAGMKVEVIEKSDSGWWFVNAEDEQGWVPSTYLEPVSGTKDNTVLRAKPGEEEKYICIADFAPNAESGPDEIPLSKGAMVEVIEKNLDGWWVVRYGGRQGVAPATYLLKAKDVQAQHLAEQSRSSGVEIIPSLSSISNIISRPSSSASDTTDSPKSPSGNDALNRAIKKRTLERAGSLKPPPRQNSIPAASPDDVPTPTTPKSHYATLADFSAQMDDGISFSAGQEVQVMEKTSTGWWFVQIGDKEGWAPASYIEKKSFSMEETPEKQASAPAPSVITTAAPASISVKKPPAAVKPVEPEDDFSDSDGFEDSDDDMPRKPAAAALASALRSQMEKKPLPPMPPSKSAASAPKPSTPATKPGPPGKPLMPPKVSAERKSSSPVERVEDTPAPAPASSQENGSGDGERRASGVAPGGNAFLSQLQSRLQSGNKNRMSEAEKDKEVDTKPPARPASTAASSAALFSPKPFKPQLPKKVLPPTPTPAPTQTTDGASASATSSAPARPSLPKKPPLAEKPKLAQKPSLPQKPRPPSKPLTKTVSLSGKDAPKDETPAGPPKLPSQPPKVPSQPSKQPDQLPKQPSQPPKLPSKPAAPSKPKSDTNNNKGNDSEKNCTAPGGVQGLAAALKSKMESSGTPRPQLPTKTPSSGGAAMRNGSMETSSSKTSSSGSSPSDSAADVPKANVGSLVSALSGKLSFGGPPPDVSGSRNSAAARDPSPVHTPTPEPVSAAISQINASSKSSSASSSVERYTVIADFSGETDTEITLYEGDTVEVLERCNEDWWLVKVGGMEGYAPTSYLEPCTSASLPTSTASSHSSNRVSTTSSSLATAARYTTCAAFVAEHEGELGFEEGTILDDVLDKTDSEWWLISYGGKEGWAPASYIVETVPPRVESLRASANHPVSPRQW